MAGPQIVFQFSQQLNPIHLRHHYIAQDDIRNMVQRGIISCSSIAGSENLVIRIHYDFKVINHILVILYDEQAG